MFAIWYKNLVARSYKRAERIPLQHMHMGQSRKPLRRPNVRLLQSIAEKKLDDALIDARREACSNQ